MGRRIILGSASPRRRELLAKITPDFEILVSDCDETLPEGTLPADAVTILAARKGRAVLEALASSENVLVIACDTLVAVDERILGKPADEAEAFQMIRALAGREHAVYSGVYLGVSDGEVLREECFYEKTEVHFMPLTDQEILDYVASGEPLDKAGAYGIQGLAGKFITRIDGDYYNVVGLPLASLYQHMKALDE